MAVTRRPFLLTYPYKISFMRGLLTTIAIAASAAVHAQPTINVDDSSKFTNAIVYLNSVNGVPFVTAKYARVVEGSVFIPETLSPAQIFIKGNSRSLTNVSARINVIDNQLNYFDEKKGIELSTTSPILEVRFKDPVTSQVRIYMQGIPDCPGSAPGWHELLEKGKLNLYRQILKSINETKPYGSATAEQTVITIYNYWIQTGTEACRPVKKISELIDLLSQADPAFRSKLPQKKFSEKKEEDWTEVVRLYNASH